MISGIKGAAQDALDKTERLTKQIKKFDIDSKLIEARKQSLESSYKVLDASTPEAPKNVTATWLKKEEDEEPAPTSIPVEDPAPQIEAQDVMETPTEIEEAEKKMNGGSFFDDIE